MAWVGQCKAAGTGEPPICDKHRADKCWCGAQAVRQCSVAGSLVCGAPLCADHECIYTGEGMTGTSPHSDRGNLQRAEWLKQREAIHASAIRGARLALEALKADAIARARAFPNWCQSHAEIADWIGRQSAESIVKEGK